MPNEPANKRQQAMSPTGSRIIGLVETVPVTYPVRAWVEGEGVGFDYTGAGEKTYWDCSEPTKRPGTDGKPEFVFQDEAGDEWLESQIVPGGALEDDETDEDE
jgi:hypothetical protein